MIINFYFQKDPKTVEYHIDPDLEDVLAIIENVIGTYQCDDVILVGDLNIDFKRKNGHAKRLETFLASGNLESSWKKIEVDYTHEFEVDEQTYTCTIDHIIWNENFFTNVENARVIHLPDNTSDHSPIFCRTKETCQSMMAQIDTKLNSRVNLKSLKPSNWNNYTTILEEKL